jgi:hypothetical protein
MEKPSISQETTISGRKEKTGITATLVKIYKASLENDKWVNYRTTLTVIITVQPTYFKSR